MPRTTRARERQSRRDRAARHPYCTRVVEFAYRRRTLHLALSQDLFSSAAIDVGTLRLLRLLAKEPSPLSCPGEDVLSVLDLGCGTGALGLAAAASNARARVTMTDRDRLAVALARHNAAANDLVDRTVALEAGPGYGPARRAGSGPFDLILTNLPAKAGTEGIRELLFGAGSLLAPGGALAFVHVTPLTPVIERLLEEESARGVAFESVSESRGREHTARLLRFRSGLSRRPAKDPLQPWIRADAPRRLLLRNLPRLQHTAVFDVPEFDTPHFRTPLLYSLIHAARPPERLAEPERVLILNPCHGFLAQMVLFRRDPAEIAFSTRDTLEQAVAERNLRASIERHGLTTALVALEGEPDLPWLPRADGRPFDLIAGPLRWNEGKEAVRHTLSALCGAMRPDGRSLLAVAVQSGQADALRKLAQASGLRPGRVLHRRGHAALLLRRPRVAPPEPSRPPTSGGSPG